MSHAIFIAWLHHMPVSHCIALGTCAMLSVLSVRVWMCGLSGHALRWWRQVRWVVWTLTLPLMVSLAVSATLGGIAMLPSWSAVFLLALGNALLTCWLRETMRTDEALP